MSTWKFKLFWGEYFKAILRCQVSYNGHCQFQTQARVIRVKRILNRVWTWNPRSLFSIKIILIKTWTLCYILQVAESHLNRILTWHVRPTNSGSLLTDNVPVLYVSISNETVHCVVCMLGWTMHLFRWKNWSLVSVTQHALRNISKGHAVFLLQYKRNAIWKCSTCHLGYQMHFLEPNVERPQ